MPQPRSQSGVSLTESGLILACVVCLCIAALQILGSQVSGNFNFVNKQIKKVNGNSGKVITPPITNPTIPEDPDNWELKPYPEDGVGGGIAEEKPNGNPTPASTEDPKPEREEILRISK